MRSRSPELEQRTIQCSAEVANDGGSRFRVLRPLWHLFTAGGGRARRCDRLGPSMALRASRKRRSLLPGPVAPHLPHVEGSMRAPGRCKQGNGHMSERAKGGSRGKHPRRTGGHREDENRRTGRRRSAREGGRGESEEQDEDGEIELVSGRAPPAPWTENPLQAVVTVHNPIGALPHQCRPDHRYCERIMSRALWLQNTTKAPKTSRSWMRGCGLHGGTTTKSEPHRLWSNHSCTPCYARTKSK